MKSNNHFNKIFNNARYFLLIPLIVVMLAVIFFIIFSFNKGYEFRQSYQYTVSYKTTLSSTEYNQCKNIIENNLYDTFGNKITVITQKQNEDIEISTLVKVYSKKDISSQITTLNDTIKSQINTKIGGGHAIFSDVNLAKSQYFGTDILFNCLSIIAIMAAMFVVFWIIFELKTAITSLIIAPFISLMYTALYVLFRLPVSNLFFVPMLISIFAGYTIFIIFEHQIRTNLKDDKFSKASNADVMLDALKKCSTKLLSLIAVLTLINIVMLFMFTKRFIIFGISGLIGLILAVYASIIVTSIVWAKIYRRDKDKNLKREIEGDKKSEAELKKEGNKKKTKEQDDKLLV